MRGRALIVCLLAMACGSHRESAEPRGPVASPDWRCTLRISDHGTFVDGERVSRADAVAHCKRAPGGAVVVLAEGHEDSATKAEWAQTRSALEREGVRFYVRGPLCYDPHVRGCWPKLPSKPTPPVTRRIVEPEPAPRPLPPPEPGVSK